MNVDDTQVPQAGVDYTWEGDAISSYEPSFSPVREPTPSSTSRTLVSQVGVRTQSKWKISATTVQPLEPMELVQSLIFAFTAQGESSTSASNDDTTSEVLKVLKDMKQSQKFERKREMKPSPAYNAYFNDPEDASSLMDEDENDSSDIFAEGFSFMDNVKLIDSDFFNAFEDDFDDEDIN
ncbi:hypothetical protein GIB67_024614 [Kingdonia uniflora]|uniref:Uncharacterized protein n=1 Tax=Kingdonia uniflora TaxID=39325 RepID=A0A7J7LP30_9MAGN|nr:hypothetical protein GIB67_024614 [Kingdonia uniflora]